MTPSTPITLSIVEDDRLTRESVVALLGGQPALRCVGTYASGEDAVRGIPKEKPDVALVDINLPGMNGIACVQQLTRLLPGLHVLMLTTYEDSDLIFESLRAGASGYLLKKTIPRDLITAIAEVHAGGAPMSTQIARKVVEYFNGRPDKPRSEVDDLTVREQEILALLAQGYLYKEIGDRLQITLGTVRTHMQHIYEKLHVRSRTAATLKFLQWK